MRTIEPIHVYASTLRQNQHPSKGCGMGRYVSLGKLFPKSTDPAIPSRLFSVPHSFFPFRSTLSNLSA